MGVVNENVEEYILNFSTIIEFQSWKVFQQPSQPDVYKFYSPES